MPLSDEEDWPRHESCQPASTEPQATHARTAIQTQALPASRTTIADSHGQIPEIAV